MRPSRPQCELIGGCSRRSTSQRWWETSPQGKGGVVEGTSGRPSPVHSHARVPRGVLEAVNAPGGAREDLVEVAPGQPGRAQASRPSTPR